MVSGAGRALPAFAARAEARRRRARQWHWRSARAERKIGRVDGDPDDPRGDAMSDVNRGDRPLSPHLTIYRPQITSALSIFHRLTGVALTLGMALAVWWLLAAATSPEYFAMVDGLLTSWFGLLILLCSTWALAYHLLNGARHLIWDMGYGLDLKDVTRSGYAVLAGSGALTLLVWIVA